MSKQWFLIESMGTTIDLSLISHVIWNHKTDRNVYTEISLGTSAAYDPDTAEVTGDRWWIHNRDDRKKLQSALVVLGLPTVELVFGKND